MNKIDWECVNCKPICKLENNFYLMVTCEKLRSFNFAIGCKHGRIYNPTAMLMSPAGWTERTMADLCGCFPPKKETLEKVIFLDKIRKV